MGIKVTFYPYTDQLKVKPTPIQQAIDYAQFLACNAIADGLDAWRSFQRFMDTEWVGGAIFGAVLAVYIMIVGGL